MKTVYQLVKNTGFTVKDLADKLSVSKTTLEKYMNGTRTPSSEMLDLIYYYAKEINPASWHCGIIDFYNDTMNGSATLRLLDIVNGGLQSIQKTDFEYLKALHPYLPEPSAKLVSEIVSEQDNNNVESK